MQNGLLSEHLVTDCILYENNNNGSTVCPHKLMLRQMYEEF